MILFISDFDLRGSGYMNIAVSLCNQLAKRGYDVTALGVGYNFGEHSWPFQIIPVSQGEMMLQIPAMIHNFRAMAMDNAWKNVEAIVVALDIPLQEKLLQIDRGSLPWIGIFPVESGPLCPSWASTLSFMTERLVISEFGAKMVKDAGVEATYLPVGIDSASWRPPLPDERKSIRTSLGFKEGDFVVLTVADNQERKNLSVAMDAVARARQKVNAKWVLVSRLNSVVGWKLNDLAASFKMTDHFLAFNRDLPFDRLWILYAAADAFLLTSKAEGLCLPILEAMSTATPVIATECTAIPEHIYVEPDWSRVEAGSWRKGYPKGTRGIGVQVEYETIDPWGNSVRSFASPKSAAEAIVGLAKKGAPNDMIDKALEYARSRTWNAAGDVTAEAIRRAVAAVASAETFARSQDETKGLPASTPRPLPPMYGIPDQGEIGGIE